MLLRTYQVYVNRLNPQVTTGRALQSNASIVAHNVQSMKVTDGRHVHHWGEFETNRKWKCKKFGWVF